MIDSPSGRSPEVAPRWYLTGTEGYVGGKVVLWLPLMFLGYKSIYRQKKYVGGAMRGPTRVGAFLPAGRALLPCGLLVESRTSIPSLLDCFWSKKDPREGFIPFGLRLIFLFCKTLK